MKGSYEIVLKSPLGPKKGILNIVQEEDDLKGSMECLGKKHTFSGTLNDEGKLEAEGVLQTPLGEEPFTITGSINGKMLIAAFKRRNESYEMLGLRIEIK